MSKIICDICGTAYSETAKQCPICGSIRPGDVQRITNEVKSDGNVSTGYTYVKGGRFSKSNVKKRANAQPARTESAKNPAPNNKNGKNEKENRALVVVAIVLLLAIIAVVVFIAVKVFGPISKPDDGTKNTVNQGAQNLACTDLKLGAEEITFEQIGEARLLSVTAEPRDTSDVIKYSSENEAVATVNKVGKVVAVGEGTTKIVITCGNVTKTCTVTVQLPQDSTPGSTTGDPTEGTTVPDESTAPQETLRLNRSDMTLSQKGESWVLYDGSIAKNLITWTSDDETVVTFKEGKVVAVGGGMTTVHAEYGDQKVSCIVRCSFQESSGVVGNGGVSEDGGGSGVITGKITNVQENVNVRADAGTNYEKVGTLNLNETVTITEQKTGTDGMTWGKTSLGWVRMDFVKVDGN